MGSKIRRGIAATAGAAALAVAASGLVAPAAAAEELDGSLVMIGGNLEQDAEILQRIVDLAREADDDGGAPTIAIITAAARPAGSAADAADDSLNNAAANGLYYGGLFEELGAEVYAVPIDTAVNYAGDPYRPSNANSPKVADEVAKADGVFFGGGDQMRYVRTLLKCNGAADEAFTRCKDTAVLEAVRAVLDRGGVVAGTSAGTTIMQGADMVTGGESYQGWRDGSAPGYFSDATKLAYVPYGGFGFFDAGLADSHFATWARQARQIRLLLDTGNDRTFGIDETTALVVDRGTGTGEVIGRNGVSVIDVSGAVDGGSTVTGVRWSYAVAGDRIDLATGRVLPSGAPLSGAGAAPAEIEDAWDSVDGPGSLYSLRDLARDLVSSAGREAVGTTYESDPRYATTLMVDGRTGAWQSGAAIGFGDLLIGIAPTA